MESEIESPVNDLESDEVDEEDIGDGAAGAVSQVVGRGTLSCRTCP